MSIREQAPNSPPLAPLDVERAVRLLKNIARDCENRTGYWHDKSPELRALAERLSALLKDGERLDWLARGVTMTTVRFDLTDFKWIQDTDRPLRRWIDGLSNPPRRLASPELEKPA